MKLSDIKAWIWDFDGTLFDTYPYTMDCIEKAVQQLGGSVDRMTLYGWLMQSIPYAHKKVREQLGYGDEYGYLYTDIRGTDFRKEGEPFEHAEELLQYLCETGRQNYMFTHRVHDVWDFLKFYGFDKYFTRVLTLADGVEPKPSPQAIEYLCNEYNLDKSLCVMVGDREIDVLSGVNAGIKTVHVTNHLPYTAFETDRRFEDIGQVLDELKAEDCLK